MTRGLVLLAFTGCGFSTGGQVATDATVGEDTATISCGNLTCDGHAVCLEGPARCECSAGYAGDGMTCTDIDECAVANGGCPAACANASGSFACYAPQTCGDIAQRVPGFAGGTQTLYLGGAAAKPWQASCEGTAAAWKEYLVLSSANNYAQYTASGPGTSVRTVYTRVRIIPASATIDIGDQTHATSTGSLMHTDGTQVTSMPYAVAMNCAGNGSQTGAARIDLAGTPFVIIDSFEVRGNQANGATSIQNGGRQVTISGGGNCGWMAPAPAPFNPFNVIMGGAILDLGYAP